MLTRRMALFGALCAVGVPGAGQAAMRCGPFNYQGIQICEAGVEVARATARQARQNWCWAACIQAVFRHHGFRVSQERIVEKVFGHAANTPAAGPQIVEAVDGDWTSDDGREFMAEAEVLWDTTAFFGRPDAAAQAARELAADNPLIVGAFGHATVLTGMTYMRDAWGRGQPIQLVVRDPWPENPNRRILEAHEVMTTTFLAKVRVE